MDLREVGYDDRDWINLAQDRDRWRAYVRAAMNLRFLKSHFDEAESNQARGMPYQAGQAEGMPHRMPKRRKLSHF
ncbi:hypothetical protein ANN_16334 [Periplaneta americana]|uniref:Uncharacterized protein n=1 Tax=Periplaneta americana TaxID=6978 RepID=A0ABQ8SJT8_PERAM|nr:hypothetical protein ANN_16334 [Periplaneta americana]